MSEVLVFSNENAEDITSVLKSFNNDLSVMTQSFADQSPVKDPSELKCIVICFRENELESTLNSSCQKLDNFIKNNRINSRIPVIPVIFEVESKEFPLKTLTDWFNEHTSLNSLKKGLIWYKSESSAEFKNKITRAQYQSGYPVTKSSYEDDDDLSAKNASIASAVATVGKYVFIVLGIILGLVVGGLIGGLVFGGLAAILGGLAIGAVSGPIVGWLSARILCGDPGAAAAELADSRANALLQEKELNDRNAQWEIFQERFLPTMTPSLEPNAQGKYQPLFLSLKNDQETSVAPQPVHEAFSSDESEETIISMLPAGYVFGK